LVGYTDLAPSGGTVPTPLSISPRSAFCDTKLSIVSLPRTIDGGATDKVQVGVLERLGGGADADTFTAAVAVTDPVPFSAVSV
jgi:hypothetical protein